MDGLKNYSKTIPYHKLLELILKPNLAYMVTLVTYHQQKPETVQAKILEKIQHHFQVIDKVKTMQFQVF